jgi:DNA-binding NarL/FixJ family response regulator
MKILIVDDHPIVRAGLQRLLAAEPEVEIREAASGKDGVSAFRGHPPDLVILDLNLPDIGGLEVIRRLKIVDPAARILVLSMHDDRIHVTRALQAGAAGYVSKNALPDELLDAVKRVAAGRTYVEREIAEELVFSNIQTAPHPLDQLSLRDLEILRLLAQGRSLSQIADALGISYKTAANNRSQIKAKLRVESTADLIRLAVQQGLAERDTSSNSRA